MDLIRQRLLTMVTRVPGGQGADRVGEVPLHRQISARVRNYPVQGQDVDELTFLAD
jgi:hypothetical protein